MSVTALHAASILRARDPAGRVMEHVRELKPTTITIEFIARESPKCVRIANKLNIGIEELLSVENYRYIIPSIENERNLDRKEERLKNYDYERNHSMALLRQAANRIENNPDFYSSRSDFSFMCYREKIMNEFNKLKHDMTVRLYY